MNEPSIRKIAVGPEYKSAMHFIVGQSVMRDTHEIVQIKHNDYGYQVIIQTTEGPKEIKTWKNFNNYMPVSVEYNIDY